MFGPLPSANRRTPEKPRSATRRLVISSSHSGFASIWTSARAANATASAAMPKTSGGPEKPIRAGTPIEDQPERGVAWTKTSAAFEHRRDGSREDLQVQQQRPAVDVVQVDRDPAIEVRVAPGRHLPEPGDSGLHRESPAMPHVV